MGARAHAPRTLRVRYARREAPPLADMHLPKSEGDTYNWYQGGSYGKAN